MMKQSANKNDWNKNFWEEFLLNAEKNKDFTELNKYCKKEKKIELEAKKLKQFSTKKVKKFKNDVVKRGNNTHYCITNLF